MSKEAPLGLRRSLARATRIRRRCLPIRRSCYGCALVRDLWRELAPRWIPYGVSIPGIYEGEGGEYIGGKPSPMTDAGVAGKLLVEADFDPGAAIARIHTFEGSFWEAVRVNLWRALLNDPYWIPDRHSWAGRRAR